MQLTIRIVIGLVGLFNILIGLSFLFNPAKMATDFALSPIGSQGMATMRADFPAFFLTAGIFAAWGAWRTDAKPLLVPLAMLSFALFGRFVSIGLDGAAPTTFPPMIAEAAMISLLLIARKVFSKAVA
jgi:hypothetical protein